MTTNEKKLISALKKLLKEGCEKVVYTGIGPITVFTEAYNEAEELIGRLDKGE